MNRLIGIIIAVLGLLVAVMSILKIVPGLTQTGIVMVLLGGLVIGLSFIRKPDTEGVERMSTPSTLGNIFFSPSEVFQNLRRHPRWLVALVIMTVLSAVYANLFLYRVTPERVTNFTIDKTLEMSFLNDDARKQIESGRTQTLADAKNPVLRVAQAVSSGTGMVFGMAILALVFFIFALAMGGKLNYWQAFSIAVYAYFPVAVVKFVLNSIILFTKDPVEIHPITGQSSLIQDNLSFLVSAADHPVLYTLIGAFSLLFFYWIWLNAIGLKNGGERVTPSIAWTTAISLFVILTALGTLMALIFPSFIS
jgi:hypothetical protein